MVASAQAAAYWGLARFRLEGQPAKETLSEGNCGRQEEVTVPGHQGERMRLKSAGVCLLVYFAACAGCARDGTTVREPCETPREYLGMDRAELAAREVVSWLRADDYLPYWLDKPGKDSGPLLKTAADVGAEAEDRAYAIRKLGSMRATEAVPLLTDTLGRIGQTGHP